MEYPHGLTVNVIYTKEHHIMIAKNQVFVRALNPDTSSWESVDVLDLDEISFRSWLIGMLVEGRQITTIVDDKPAIIPAKRLNKP